MTVDPFVAASAERHALALQAAENVAAVVDDVEVRVLPDQGPLGPSCAVWTTGPAPQQLLWIAANAAGTTLLVGRELHQLVPLDDPGGDGPPLIAQVGLEAALKVAIDLGVRGVPRDRGGRHVAIDCEQRTQRRKVAQVHRAAFPGPDEASLVNALRKTDAWIDALSLVAIGDAVVGHVLFTRAQIAGQTVLALAPVGVLPDWQGEGVGEALIAEGLVVAASLGYAAVAVLGDPAYYGRFGFVPAHTLGITSPADWPAEAFQARSLAGRPIPQGVLEYPAPFGV